MKKRIEAMVLRLRSAVRRHPIEVIMAVVFSLAGCLHYEAYYAGRLLEESLNDIPLLLRVAHALEGPLAYFPVLFLLTYTLNGWTASRRWRSLYFISGFFFIPFLWMPGDEIWKPVYIVSLVVVQLLYLVSGWKTDNEEFVRTGLRYARSMLSAGLLAGIAYLLAISIHASILYIFEIGSDSYRWFYTESAYLLFMGGMPLLFLMFNQEKEGKGGERNRLFEVLLNYVLSPALLIYAAILYLYFIKIAILWSLPKGAVAYIVVSFISATFILKGCQVFLTKRYYDWFYNYAGYAVLPALAMYWAGAYYRINQYGFTELRVYLVVTGLILTGLVVLFLTRRWGRYLYTACLAILLLSAVTYIPGITAKDIERISQEGRDNVTGDERHYDQMPYLNIHNEYPVDISDYGILCPIVGYKSAGLMWTNTDHDTFYLYDKDDKLMYKESLSSLWERQMRNAGLTHTDSIPEEYYPKLLMLDMDSAKLVFHTINLHRTSPDSAYQLSYLSPAYYLKK